MAGNTSQSQFSFGYMTLMILAVLAILPSVTQAHAIGPYPCYFSLELDKVEYNPGETAIITAKHCLNDSTDNATLVVADGMSMDLAPDSPIWEQYKSGKGVLFNETRQAVNGIVEFSYTIPLSTDVYRYIVMLTPGSMGGSDIAYIFSKPNASKIILSDVRLLNPQVRQGDLLNFEAKVTDGLGNPLPFLIEVNPSAIYKSCWAEYGISSINPVYSKSEEEKQNYAATGIVWGWLEIPQGYPGKYQLNVTASASSFIRQGGWSSSETKQLEFQVLAESSTPSGLELYAAYTPLIKSESPRVQVVITPPNDNNSSKHIIETAVPGSIDYVSGKISHDSCTEPNHDMPVKVEISKLFLNDDNSGSQSNVENKSASIMSCFNDSVASFCSRETIASENMTGSSTAFFGIPPELVNSVYGHGPGEYLVNITAYDDERVFSNYLGIRAQDPDDIRNYVVANQRQSEISANSSSTDNSIIGASSEDGSALYRSIQFPLVIGLGVAIAGVIAFITLRKRK